jgi:uncharacterized protein (TIGR02246 family)
MSVRLVRWTPLLILAACATQGSQTAAAPAVDSAAVRAAVSDVWARWVAADTAQDLEALLNLVTEDARLDLRGVPPVTSRTEFRAMAENAFKTMKIMSLNITPEATEAITNELAYETGNYVETYTMSGRNITDHGRYAAALVKGADGQWRVGYLMAFADSTATSR